MQGFLGAAVQEAHFRKLWREHLGKIAMLRGVIATVSHGIIFSSLEFFELPYENVVSVMKGREPEGHSPSSVSRCEVL